MNETENAVTILIGSGINKLRLAVISYNKSLDLTSSILDLNLPPKIEHPLMRMGKIVLKQEREKKLKEINIKYKNQEIDVYKYKNYLNNCNQLSLKLSNRNFENILTIGELIELICQNYIFLIPGISAERAIEVINILIEKGFNILDENYIKEIDPYNILNTDNKTKYIKITNKISEGKIVHLPPKRKK